MKINTVTVLGANGTMGTNISAIFAAFGGCKVYMMCRTKEQAEKARTAAVKTVRANSIMERLIPTTYDDISELVPKSDLVFESVSESLDIKNEINKKVSKYIVSETIFCTGTSGLSVDCLAENLPVEIAEKYLGIHFFNPPYNMPLCELIPTEYTEKDCVKSVKKYLKENLYRTVVTVKDEAGFLGNRIGFFFINEAFLYAERYKEQGGIDYIDEILGGFTGRNMPPIVTSDFVGLDVHKAIVENIYKNGSDFSKDSFKTPLVLKTFIEANQLGRKLGQGAYKTVVDETGKKHRYIYDILSGVYREKRKYDFPFKMEILELLTNGNYKAAMEILAKGECRESRIARDFLIRYTIYALYISGLICEKISYADDVMATGFGWIPPLAVIDAFGGKTAFIQLVKVADMNYMDINEAQVANLINEAPKSKYDYRKYLKAF
ncbi:MAG: 3-hydroxyacyl-CoA dehydrogenase family protein [Clostridiales bacterium]|nr:3-hydroxyacyl-CoA dehydrogenase family protein [Clostridiales bacterium]